MKLRTLLASSLLLTLLPLAHADGVADFARAQVMFARVMNGLAEAKKISNAMNAASAPAVAVQAPAPLTDKSGHYFLPYTADGHLTDWAQKALGAQVGAAIGAQAGEKAGGALLAKVPFGGLMSGAVKKKSKELGALAAVGGPEFVKQTSNLSFNSINDYAVYLHVNHAGDPDYVKALAAAMAIYPDLEKNYEGAVKLAYGTK